MPEAAARAHSWESMASDLAAFIAELRRRLNAGELDGIADLVDEQGATLPPAAVWATQLLDEVDEYQAMDPQTRALFAEQRRGLAQELEQLRAALERRSTR